MVGNKHAFWQALVFTVIVFIFGLLIGFFLEGYSADKIEQNLAQSEINVLDEQLRGDVIDNFDVDCSLAKENLFEFADNVYYEALKLESIDETDKFDRGFKLLHKKYDLLRLMIWQEAIDLKDNCDSEFNSIVYIYSYEDVENDFQRAAIQKTYSRILGQLKANYPEDVLLIPIAGDMDLASVDLILDSFGIEELPVIIVNEERIISGVPTYDELEKVVLESNN